MVSFAKAELTAAGAEVAADISIAGSYEVPLVLDAVLQDSQVDGAVVLGYIDKGETLHGEVMGQVVFRTILDLELKYQKPVGMGIIGPGATPEQAEARKETAARGAVKAVLRSLATLTELSAAQN